VQLAGARAALFKLGYIKQPGPFCEDAAVAFIIKDFNYSNFHKDQKRNKLWGFFGDAKVRISL